MIQFSKIFASILVTFLLGQASGILIANTSVYGTQPQSINGTVLDLNTSSIYVTPSTAKITLHDLTTTTKPNSANKTLHDITNETKKHAVKVGRSSLNLGGAWQGYSNGKKDGNNGIFNGTKRISLKVSRNSFNAISGGKSSESKISLKVVHHVGTLAKEIDTPVKIHKVKLFENNLEKETALLSKQAEQRAKKQHLNSLDQEDKRRQTTSREGSFGITINRYRDINKVANEEKKDLQDIERKVENAWKRLDDLEKQKEAKKIEMAELDKAIYLKKKEAKSLHSKVILESNLLQVALGQLQTAGTQLYTVRKEVKNANDELNRIEAQIRDKNHLLKELDRTVIKLHNYQISEEIRMERTNVPNKHKILKNFTHTSDLTDSNRPKIAAQLEQARGTINAQNQYIIELKRQCETNRDIGNGKFPFQARKEVNQLAQELKKFQIVIERKKTQLNKIDVELKHFPTATTQDNYNTKLNQIRLVFEKESGNFRRLQSRAVAEQDLLAKLHRQEKKQAEKLDQLNKTIHASEIELKKLEKKRKRHDWRFWKHSTLSRLIDQLANNIKRIQTEQNELIKNLAVLRNEIVHKELQLHQLNNHLKTTDERIHGLIQQKENLAPVITNNKQHLRKQKEIKQNELEKYLRHEEVLKTLLQKLIQKANSAEVKHGSTSVHDLKLDQAISKKQVELNILRSRVINERNNLTQINEYSSVEKRKLESIQNQIENLEKALINLKQQKAFSNKEKELAIKKLNLLYANVAKLTRNRNELDGQLKNLQDTIATNSDKLNAIRREEQLEKQRLAEIRAAQMSGEQKIRQIAQSCQMELAKLVNIGQGQAEQKTRLKQLQESTNLERQKLKALYLEEQKVIENIERIKKQKSYDFSNERRYFEDLSRELKNEKEVLVGWHKALKLQSQAMSRNCDSPAPSTNTSDTLCSEKLRAITSIFDKESMSDFRFIVDDNSIFVSRDVLSAASEYMRLQFTSTWRRLSSLKVQAGGISYNVYKAYLHFLYTGLLDGPVNHDNLKDKITLLVIAHLNGETNLEAKLAISLARVPKPQLKMEIIQRMAHILQSGSFFSF